MVLQKRQKQSLNYYKNGYEFSSINLITNIKLIELNEIILINSRLKSKGTGIKIR